jgi:hypothetical protein
MGIPRSCVANQIVFMRKNGIKIAPFKIGRGQDKKKTKKTITKKIAKAKDIKSVRKNNILTQPKIAIPTEKALLLLIPTKMAQKLIEEINQGNGHA